MLLFLLVLFCFLCFFSLALLILLTTLLFCYGWDGMGTGQAGHHVDGHGFVGRSVPIAPSDVGWKMVTCVDDYVSSSWYLNGVRQGSVSKPFMSTAGMMSASFLFFSSLLFALTVAVRCVEMD